MEKYYIVKIDRLSVQNYWPLADNSTFQLCQNSSKAERYTLDKAEDVRNTLGVFGIDAKIICLTLTIHEEVI